MNSLPWYHKGLPFKCTGCGQCCTGAPGYVFVTPTEIEAMAEHLGMSLAEFSQKYIRKVGSRFSLKEHSKTFDCVFLKDKMCTVYSVRPRQCQTFPWWEENLENASAWEEAKNRCEGIGHELAPIVPLETIQLSLEEC